MSTNRDTKKAATSVATSTIRTTHTPGAVRPVDASSIKNQQTFQTTKVSTDGPSYYPEDHEQQHQQPKRAAAEYRSDSKDTVASQDEKLKRNAARKDQIVSSKATQSADSMNDLSVADQKIKRSLARQKRILSRVSGEDSKQEVEHDLDEEEEAGPDEVTPGAVEVAGMISTSSAGSNQEDGVPTRMPEETMNEQSTRMILEANLVVEEEEDIDRPSQEEELRQKFHKFLGEMGQGVAQAEVMEEDGSKTRRWWAMLYAGIAVTVLAIIVACVLGVLGARDTISIAATAALAIASAPSPATTSAPTRPPTSPIPLSPSSCQGSEACTGVKNTIMGDNSCNGGSACPKTFNSTIGQESCVGRKACASGTNNLIGSRSCVGPDSVCLQIEESTVGAGSCVEDAACSYSYRTKIGDNSCKLPFACQGSSDSILGRGSCYGNNACDSV